MMCPLPHTLRPMQHPQAPKAGKEFNREARLASFWELSAGGVEMETVNYASVL